MVAASTKAPHVVVDQDFKQSEVLSTYKPSLAAAEWDRPDHDLVYAALGLE